MDDDLTRGPLDALERMRRSRHVTVDVPSYAVGALVALEYDVICSLPHVTAAHPAECGVPLHRHEVPLELRTAVVELRCHRCVEGDPASHWFRDHLRDSIEPLTAGGSG